MDFLLDGFSPKAKTRRETMPQTDSYRSLQELSVENDWSDANLTFAIASTFLFFVFKASLHLWAAALIIDENRQQMSK